MTLVDPAQVRQLQSQVGDRLQQAQQAAKASGRPPLSGEHERQYARQLINAAIGEHATSLLETGQPPLDWEAERELNEAVFARLFGAGRLQPLIDDLDIENIDINGHDEVWVTYAGGEKVRAEPVAESDEELVELVQTLASYAGRSSRPFDAANPEVDLKLPDGSRLSGITEVAGRPAVSIRRHRFTKVTLADLVGNQTLSPEAADFLAAAVRARTNLMIAGATDTGKTTLLRALAAEIAPQERIITVERALELSLRHDTDRHPDCVELEERQDNSEGHGAVTMAQLVRRTLRMNPDRVIVGEVLGDEVVTMLNAMSQGNDGSLSTIHARSALEVFNRLCTYALQAEEKLPAEACSRLIAGGLDFVIYVVKDGAHRRLDSIREINGFDGTTVASSEVFATGPGGGFAERNLDVAVSRASQLASCGWQPGDGWGM